MNTRAIVTVILKILGIYVFLQFLNVLPMVISLLQVNTDILLGHPDPMASRMGISTPMGFYLALMSVIYLGSASMLMFKSRYLAGLFTYGLPDEGHVSGIGSDHVLTLSFQCIGLYAVVTWLPQFLQTLCRTLIYRTWTDPQVPLSMRFYENWSVLIGPLMGTLIGILLIFKLAGLLRLIKLARPMALENKKIQK